MQLSKIRIKNYRLLIDAELEVDPTQLQKKLKKPNGKVSVTS